MSYPMRFSQQRFTKIVNNLYELFITFCRWLFSHSYVIIYRAPYNGPRAQHDEIYVPCRSLHLYQHESTTQSRQNGCADIANGAESLNAVGPVCMRRDEIFSIATPVQPQKNDVVAGWVAAAAANIEAVYKQRSFLGQGSTTEGG